MPPQAPQQVPPFIKPNNLEEEIIKLKNDVRILKERVSALEKKEKNGSVCLLQSYFYVHSVYR